MPDGDAACPGFGDRFEVIGCLGARGMGVVYEAFDRERGERVAIKTGQRLDPLGLALFKNEFRALADIDHPHLVRLYELFRSEGAGAEQWFFTMELIDGPGLMAWLRGGDGAALAATDPASGAAARGEADTLPPPPTPTGPFEGPGEASEARLRRAAAQIALAVAALHARGLLHRDIKPDNVRVDQSAPDGRVVLLDFGLAVRTDGSAGEGVDGGWVMGTRGFMSPQQAAGQPPSESDDWYGFGALLYAALTGAPPSQDADGAARAPPSGPADLVGLALDLLAPEPEARPGAAAVLRRVGVDPARARWRSPPVGRREVMARLDEALGRASAGALTLCHLWGRSGMGKTCVVEQWLTRIEGRRAPTSGDSAASSDPAGARAGRLPDAALVLRGRSHRREDVPFGPFDALVDDLARRLADWAPALVEAVLPRHVEALCAMFPVLDRLEAAREAPGRQRVVDPRLRRDRAAHALRELIARLADRRPVVISLDDVQHGGADSAALFEALFSPPDPPAVMVISTARETEGSPLLEAARATTEALGGDWAAHCVEVGPLTVAESRLLAERLLGRGRTRRQVDTVVIESEGHPLLITELAAQVRLQLQGGGDLDLGAVIRSRVADLPPSARALLELVVVADGPLTARTLVAASAAEPETGRALATLRAASLVRGGIDPGGVVEVFHDAITDAVTARLAPERRAALHRALAEAIEAAPTPEAEPLVRHWRGAGEPTRAAQWAVEGGRAAMAAGAFEQAAALFRQAITGGRASAATTRALAEALQYAGRADEAAEAWMVAAEAAPWGERADAERRAAEQWLIGGRLRRARRLLSRLARTVGLRPTRRRWRVPLTWAASALRWWIRGRRGRLDLPRPSRRHAARFDVALAGLNGWYAVDIGTVIWLMSRASFAGLASGDPARAAAGLALGRLLVMWTRLPGRDRAAARLLAAAETVGGEAEPARVMVEVSGIVGDALRAHDWRAVIDRSRALEPVLESAPAWRGWEPLVCRSLYCLAALLDARYDALRARLPELLGDARRRGARVEEALIALLGGVTVHLVADDPDGAEQALAAVRPEWLDEPSSALSVLTRLARLRILRYRGALRDALDVGRRRDDRRIDFGSRLWLEHGLSVLALSETLPLPETRAEVRHAVRLLHHRTSRPGSRAWAAVLTAGLTRAEGDPAEAVRRLDAARAAFPVGLPPRDAPLFDRARALWCDDPAGVAAADAALRAQGVRDPVAWSRALLPLP